jgi:23S rRNA G2445 N2-methylase RlmL
LNYKYIGDDNFEDFASGRVFYHKPGMPNFPVRLAGEIFGRCLSYTDKKQITLYDPCCGSSYMLAVLGLLNIKTIKKIVASDISEDAIEVSKGNLALLTEDGLRIREKQIQQMMEEYQKPSHYEALESVHKFIDLVRSRDHDLNIDTFVADILAPGALKNKFFKADIVITDVPYGNLANWSDQDTDASNRLLDNLVPILSEDSVVAVITDKSQKCSNEKYKRLEKFKVGKRQISILRLHTFTQENE